jgi:ABC-2 type transport system ATP-binding protein
MTDIALETVNLGRRYGKKWGLRDCSLTVPVGAITGLVGPNGAGKSSLLRLAAGLSRPTTGSVSVFGEQVRPNSTSHLARIGYFDQLRPLYGNLRVDEMLTFGRRLNSVWDNDAAVGWLSELNIPLERRVESLSLGQQALVALALCMGKCPDLLLLDEPAASLDPLARRQLLETLLGSVAERGTTVFLSSHIVSELEPVCDSLIILSASSVQISGTVESLLGDHRILVGSHNNWERPPEVDVISIREAGRQSTLLIRGDLKNVGSEWQVLEPSLDEIVLAYLSRGPAEPPADTGDSPHSVKGDQL